MGDKSLRLLMNLVNAVMTISSLNIVLIHPMVCFCDQVF